MTHVVRGFAIGLSCAASLIGCGSSSSGGAPIPFMAGDAQTPPMGASNVVTWLATGQYKAWHCESAVHAPRITSPHAPFDRVCSNELVNANVTATTPRPEGAAEVKEIYNNLTDTTPTGGYAVSLKTSGDSAGGANWYFYENVNGTAYADGMGTQLCVGCHESAGTSAANTPIPGARDFVYTPVP